jgi:hypothetical protein
MTSWPYTRDLSGFVAGLAFEDIPGDVVERIKLLVLDTIGAGLLGAGMPWSIRMRAHPVDRGDGRRGGMGDADKFHKLTQRFSDDTTQQRAITLCNRLETLENTGELLALLQMENLPPVDTGGE